MQDNPYSAILNITRRDQRERAVAAWVLGRVISRSPAVVRLGEARLSGADLLVNPLLLRSDRESELMEPGDQVVMLQSGDGQQYVVLCKVVSG